MKTLYININGENIQSTENIIVVGRPEDAIINKFFFELGKEILKGVVVPGVTSIKKKDIVTDFKAHDEKSFYRIMDQWDTLKQELLGENPSGSRTVKLPDEYISWLQDSSQPAYSEIAKALYKRGGSVEVSIAKIYKNAIGIIVNNIEPENCKGCGQFVVNDDAVTDDSAITASIQEIMPQIAFVPFEDFGKCPKCGKKPCECKPELPICPKCGKNPCKCDKINYDNFYRVILFSVGPNRLQVIKSIKECFGLSKSEATNLVDNAPSILADERIGHEAICIKDVIESVHAKVKLEKIENNGGKIYKSRKARGNQWNPIKGHLGLPGAFADDTELDEESDTYDEDYSNTYFDEPGNVAAEILENALHITGDDYHFGDTLYSLGVDEVLLNSILGKCAKQLNIPFYGKLDVYNDKVSNYIRLVQKNYRKCNGKKCFM